MSSEAPVRPNVVYLNSHDTGRYVSPYGHATPTPRMQQLAEEGVVFRRAFSAAPTCSPSRAALLTGQTPHSAGMLGLAHRGFRLNDENQHLAAVLRAAGYQAVLMGGQHVAADDHDLPYDIVPDTRRSRVREVAPATIKWLRQRASSGDARPFYLEVGMFETHREYPEPEPRDDARYIAPPAAIVDTPRTRADMAAYHASVRELDRGYGQILDALRETKLDANTIVVCTTDHGLAFPGMKCNLTADGTGVLLILRGPAPIGRGVVSDALVSQVDLFPTICELTDVPAPDWLQGRSLVPLLTGERTEVNDAVFAEVTYHAAYEPQRSARTGRWNYIRRFGDRVTPVLPNVDEGPSRDLWLENGWPDRKMPVEALYDVVLDPNEMDNLADDPAFATVLDEMRWRLDGWMRRTDDPLLRGPVPVPLGVVVNDPDDESPSGALYRAGANGALIPASDPPAVHA